MCVRAGHPGRRRGDGGRRGPHLPGEPNPSEARTSAVPKAFGGAVLTYRSGLLTGLVVQLVLLFGLAATVGLTPGGWVAGLLCAVVINVAVARALRAAGRRPGAGDVVTLSRAMLACAAAALVADSWQQRPAVAALVALATT